MKKQIYYGLFDRNGKLGINYDGRLLIYTAKKYAKSVMPIGIDSKCKILPLTLNVKI